MPICFLHGIIRTASNPHKAPEAIEIVNAKKNAGTHGKP
jgi:hypothetical protein